LMLSPECKCEDGPMLELLRKDQSDALDAWDATADEIGMPGGPDTMAEAVRAFQMRFQGDSRVTDQYKACADFDPAVNKVTKIAGVSILNGGAALDPCFCKQFCQGAIVATAKHEDVHFRFGFEALLEQITANIACKAGQLEQSYCDTLHARQLARSEQYAHSAGIESLQDALDKLRMSDPENPDMECTWEPLPDMVTEREPAPPVPGGFWDRIQMLAGRFIHGRSSSAG
jgi:hypothetical protein